jgi:hypothetical protein
MSTLRTINVIHPSGSTTNIVNDASGNVAVGNNLTVAGTSTISGNETVTGTLVMGSSFKRNRIINGNMVVDQRNAGASVTANTSPVFPVDRFYCDANANGVFTAQRSTTAPTGFTNSVILTVTTARTSIAASDVYAIRQQIEGFNTADLGWGTASAQSVTLSFWVRSSITGTYAVAFFNSAFNRSYVATYTVNAANTFEQKTITIAGDTTGTWLTDNGIGLSVLWDLGSGSNYNGTAGSWAAVGRIRTSATTNWISTNGATFYITGVQLEVGTKATPYEMQIYSDQLAQCQRYYWKSAQDGYSTTQKMLLPNTGNTARFVTFPFPVQMRSNPTVSATVSSGTASDYGTNRNIFGFQAYSLANDSINVDISAMTASAEL